MLTKTLACVVISLFVLCLVWWLVDPVGFSENAFFLYLKQLSLELPAYRR